MTGTKHFGDHLIICGDLGEPLQCELCPKMFRTEHSLKVHARAHATRKLECAHCSKKFLEKGHLVKHMALHTKEFTYKCHLCQAKFTRADNLKAHVENNHRYMCFLCRKQFSSADFARLHVQTSHTQAEIAASGTQSGFMRITKFECTFCGRCLASKQALQNHEKTHQKSVPPTEECEDDKTATGEDVRKKKFRSIADFARLHVQTSQAQEEIAASGTQSGFVRITKFECTMCGRCLDSKQALQSHERTHQGTGEFENIKRAPFPEFPVYHSGC
jgi:KRAB domain-containing zinc finger protein